MPLSLLVGSAAGILTMAYTIPLDVLATRLQTCDEARSKGLWVCARQVYGQAGLPGFWAGFGPSALLTINPAISFAVFARLKVKPAVALVHGRHARGGGFPRLGPLLLP